MSSDVDRVKKSAMLNGDKQRGNSLSDTRLRPSFIFAFNFSSFPTGNINIAKIRSENKFAAGVRKGLVLRKGDQQTRKLEANPKRK